MLIYNTTYHVSNDDARNFVIFMNEMFIPEAIKSGELKNARLSRIISHKDEESECFSVQFETEDTSSLHKWYASVGASLEKNLLQAFKNKVIGFPTLMEVIVE